MAKDLKANQKRSAACALFLAISAALGACCQASAPGTDVSAQILNNTYYESYDREPYAVRTELKEYTALNEKTGKGAYGRFTELKVEGKALELLKERAGDDFCLHVSLSHEKEYALAFVVIESVK